VYLKERSRQKELHRSQKVTWSGIVQSV